jgi:3-oxoacyl-[acyl-carrier protein] reductase
MMLLEGKNAVIYGGAGRVGRAVARAFADEGARVFLAGRTLASLDAVAEELAGAGGAVSTARVDALDERAVDSHADAVAERAGGIDVAFNAISHGDVHGAPLMEMSFEDFARPISTAVRAQFLTTRAAARHMTRQGSGVIMTITAPTAQLSIPEVGGTGVTFDAIESSGLRAGPPRRPGGLAADHRPARGHRRLRRRLPRLRNRVRRRHDQGRADRLAAAEHAAEPADVAGRGREGRRLHGLRPRRRDDRDRREPHLRPGPDEVTDLLPQSRRLLHPAGGGVVQVFRVVHIALR